METHHSRVGLVMFFIYLLFYGGFVFLNVFAADVMEITPIAGVNLAILYGFGLIITAIIMALIYGFLSNKEEGAEK